MSFDTLTSTIKAGDLSFIWVSRSYIKPVKLKEGETINTRYGIYRHSSIIGKKYGSQVASESGKGFVYVLAPTPELWTSSLPHRTQIVYTPDSSFIGQKLGIVPGTKVIEAGTGSGSLTHQFSRLVGEDGHVFTYEFHHKRYLQALEEFVDHGLQNVTVTHRDVCKGGFELMKEDGKLIEEEKKEEETKASPIKADAVFLDLPAPWDAIPHLDHMLSSKTSVCCFSPCMEQVQKTIKVLHSHGWSAIEMVEVNSKKWESHKHMVRKVDDVLKRLKDIQKRKIEGIKRVRNDDDADESTRKKQKQEARALEGTHNKSQTYNPFGKGQRIAEGDPNFEWRNVSRDEFELKSHTSFLTFAWKMAD